MAYDEALARRIRESLGATDDVDERRMFGGLAFMVGSHMVCGLVGDDLMLRVGPARAAQALAKPHARPMDFTGRPLTGMIYVAPAGCRTAASLRGWIDMALAFVKTLPPKKAAKAGTTKKAAKKATKKAAKKKATAKR